MGKKITGIAIVIFLIHHLSPPEIRSGTLITIAAAASITGQLFLIQLNFEPSSGIGEPSGLTGTSTITVSQLDQVESWRIEACFITPPTPGYYGWCSRFFHADLLLSNHSGF